MPPPPRNETGFSEIVGALVLISVFVLAFAIIAVIILSQPQPGNIPAVNIRITSEGQIVKIFHDGGDSLTTGDYSIWVDGTDITPAMIKTGSTPNQWTIGDVLTYTKPGTISPSNIKVIYSRAGSAAVVLADVRLAH